jgi:hypothetical protein
MSTMKVEAIHPHSNSGDLEVARLFENHFGPGKDAIRFSGLSSPYFSADEVEWDFVDETAQPKIF